MRVLLPYTKRSHLLQTAVDCLRIQHVQPELVKVDDGDGYHRMLSEAWEQEHTFFVVEQDILVWQGAIQMLDGCAEDWCTLPTMCHGRMITTTFGCVKFGRDLIVKRPGWWDDIPTTWFHLDANNADKMGWPYIRPHSHWPPATHLNEVQWSDSISKRYTLERKMVWQSIEEGGEPVVKVKYRLEGDGRRADRVAVGEVQEG